MMPIKNSAQVSFMISFFFMSISPITPANILLLPYPWPSHILQLELLGAELARHGHNVTMITSSQEQYSPDAYRHVNRVIYPTTRVTPNAIFELARDTLQKNQRFGISWLYQYLDIMRFSVEEAIDDPRVAQIARQGDLLLTDASYTTATAFADYFNLPLAAISPLGCMSDALGDVLGIPDNPSYMPGLLSASSIEIIGFANEMTLLERTYNLLSVLLMKFARRYIILSHLSPIEEKYKGGSLIEGWKRTRILLLPMDFAVEPAVPLPPLVKVVRPFTIGNPQELPAVFKKIIENGYGDTLLVTFGAMDSLSPQNIEALVRSLVKLKMTVIWKFSRSRVLGALQCKESKALEEWTPERSNTCISRSQLSTKYSNGDDQFNCSNLKDYMKIAGNVFVFEWVPQNDLLGNDRVRLFLSHCGRNGMYEAIYHKVPLICMPLFGDQWSNAGVIHNKKLGIAINKASQLAVKLQHAVKEIQENAIYTASVYQASNRLRREDRSTLSDAADLIERIIQNNDTEYLRPSMGDAPFYELLLLDVYFFLIIITILMAYILSKIKKAFGHLRLLTPRSFQMMEYKLE